MNGMDEPHPKIVLLGWGSLLWDKRPEFDEHHGLWQFDGPELPLDFSRISSTRNGALTLVIDNANGALCRSAYALSARRNPDDAIEDLRRREGTDKRYVGFFFRDGTRCGQPPVPDSIRLWADHRGIDVVAWTALPSNFKEITGHSFSVQNAIRQMQSLPADVKPSAAEYVWRAPDFVTTPLRTALQAQPWFAPPGPGTGA